MLNINNVTMDTQLELFEKLQKYKCVINSWMIDYLSSLLRLEFSVLRENVSKEEREVLSELEIYKKIAMYNIYHRAQKLINDSEIDFEDFEDYHQLHELCFEKMLANGKSIILFNYNYNLKCEIDENLDCYTKSMYIGEINLCHLIADDESYEKLSKKIDLYMPNLINDPVEKKLKNLISVLKYDIEMVNKVYHMFLNDYGINENDFKKLENSKLDTDFGLEKRFIKKIPNVVVYSNNQSI